MNHGFKKHGLDNLKIAVKRLLSDLDERLEIRVVGPILTSIARETRKTFARIDIGDRVTRLANSKTIAVQRAVVLLAIKTPDAEIAMAITATA